VKSVKSKFLAFFIAMHTTIYTTFISILHYFTIHNKQDLWYNTTNSHSLTHTHLRTSLHSKVTPIWAWHILSYLSTSSVYIAHFSLSISKLLFFVQTDVFFSLILNLTFDLKPHILGSCKFPVALVLYL